MNNQDDELTEKLDFTKPDFVFIPKGQHTWRQQGNYLVCKSCDIHHAVAIGIDRIMVGVDKSGNPILKKRKEM